MGQTPYRRRTDPAILDDMRLLYRKLLELERRMAQIQADNMRLYGYLERLDLALGGIKTNTEGMAVVIADLPPSRELRCQCKCGNPPVTAED